MVLVIRIIGVTVALTAAQVLGGLAVQAVVGSSAFPAPPPNSTPWQLAANLICAAMLAWLAARSTLRGWRLAGTLAFLLFGIQYFTSLIEAIAFKFFPVGQGSQMLLMTAVATLLVGPALLLLDPRSEPAEHPSWTTHFTLPRIVAGAFAYLVVYFAAGMVVIQYVGDFYASRPMPGPLTVVGMQLLVRGPLLIGLLAIVIGTSAASRRETVLLAAATLAVLGGVVPLMVPNAFFPDYVRWGHFVEVVTSNFAFGAFVAWLLGHRTPAPAEAVA